MLLKNLLYKKKAIKKLEEYKEYKNQKKILYLLSPEHGNLGDQAIAIAIKKILEDEFKNNIIIEFSYNEYQYIKKYISNISNRDDIVFLHGGGNLGNLYINEEIQRRDAIERFKNNKVIIMPQSISFTNDEAGRYEMEKTKEIYNKHKDLYIICREEKSFQTAKKIFLGNKLMFSPDSVLYLSDYYRDNLERDGVLLALRRDKEKVMEDLRVNKIKGIIQALGENIIYKDTIINKKINKNNRINEFNKILQSFGSSKIVITDRFHGAIFSYITRTPCIVFKSLDHKISEGIKWFKDVEFIHYAENNDNIMDVIKHLLDLKVNYQEDQLKDELISAIRKII